MRKIFFYILITTISGVALAQTETEDKVQAEPRSTPSPDFPGEFIIDYGINYFTDAAPAMETKVWRSPTVNVYYGYPMNFGESRFSFNPGLGLGLESFAFSAPVTLVDSFGITILEPITDLPQYENATDITYSKMSTTYLDLPLEFRVHSRRNDPKRSWFLSIGGKIGVLINSKAKVKYAENGVVKVNKNKYNYQVNGYRYGAVARIGYGPVSFWGYYRGNLFFKGNKTSGFPNPGMFSFGISLSTF